MSKTLKILGLTLAVLFGLLIAAAIVLPLVFDPNQYKGEIIRLVKEQTGRDLKIEKKIGWSFFPRLGVEAGGLELSNAPGFGKEPFAKIDAAGVHVALLPLLTGKVSVDTLYVHGLNLIWEAIARGQPVKDKNLLVFFDEVGEQLDHPFLGREFLSGAVAKRDHSPELLQTG